MCNDNRERFGLIFVDGHPSTYRGNDEAEHVPQEFGRGLRYRMTLRHRTASFGFALNALLDHSSLPGLEVGRRGTSWELELDRQVSVPLRV